MRGQWTPSLGRPPAQLLTSRGSGLHGDRHIPCRMALSLWSSRRYFSSDVSATVPIRALSEDTHGPGPSEASEPESKGSPSGGWVFRGPGFFTGELQREAHHPPLGLHALPLLAGWLATRTTEAGEG